MGMKLLRSFLIEALIKGDLREEDMGKYNKILYKKILQSVLDSKGTACYADEDECIKCPCQEYCGTDDAKHFALVEKWFKQFRT